MLVTLKTNRLRAVSLFSVVHRALPLARASTPLTKSEENERLLAV